jgi:two-component system response regulator FlrC
MRLGAFDYLSKPFSPGELVNAVKKSLRADDKLKAEVAAEAPVILTQDPALAETLAQARRAADSRATILIQAESGTGKELFAKLIHSASPRRKGPFVAINCAAIPENLLESELFGFEKGSFTGATSSKAGRFEQAEGGTLVLDEIGELPLPLQGKLLRAIQERVVDRIGGTKPITVDVRIIALTNRELAQEAKEGRFREDLYYRLNVIPLRLPPLRERLGDMRLLAAHFAERYSRENDRPTPKLTLSFFTALEKHPWPGNIRELENAMQRCVVLCSGAALRATDLEWLLGAEALGNIPDNDEIVDFTATSTGNIPGAIGAPGAIHQDQAAGQMQADVGQATRGSSLAGDGRFPDGAKPQMSSSVLADTDKPLTNITLGTPVTLPLGLPLPELERYWLLSTLAAVGGNRTHCAQQLDIALRTVRNKINEYREQGFQIPKGRSGKDE